MNTTKLGTKIRQEISYFRKVMLGLWFVLGLVYGFNAQNVAAATTTITKLELHQGAPDGTLVADLLTDPNPSLTVEQEYYLVVNVAKDATKDSWVSVELPYYLTGINMIGGTPPAVGSVNTTAIDKVISWTPATFNGTGVPGDGSPGHKSPGAGKVVYHLKKTVSVGEFALSFKLNYQYYDGSGSQVMQAPANQIKVETGDMNGVNPGTVMSTKTTNSITKTSTGYNKFAHWRGGQYPTTASGGTVKDNGALNLYKNGNSTLGGKVWTKLEFDIDWSTLPVGAEVEALTLTNAPNGGVPAEITINADGSTHYVFTNPTGSPVGNNVLNVTWATTLATPEANYRFTVKNLSSNSYGNEIDYFTVPNSPGGQVGFNVLNNLTLHLTGGDFGRYDWYGQRGVKQNTMIGFVTLYASGPSSDSDGNPLYSGPQTIHAEFADNAIVRVISLPKFTDAGTTIHIETRSGKIYDGDVADIAKLNSGNANVIAILNTDIPNVTDSEDSITSVIYDVGSLRGGQGSRNGISMGGVEWNDTYYNRSLGIWGSVTDGKIDTKTGIYTVYPTGSDADDPAAIKNVATIFDPNTVATIADMQLSNGTVTPRNITAGDSYHVTQTYGGSYLARGGNNSSLYDYNPVFYLTLPEGMSAANFTINGTVVNGDEVTTPAAEAANMRIYAFKSPDGTEAGAYGLDGKTKTVSISYDLLTAKSTEAQTFDLKKIISIGNDFTNYSQAFYASAPDIYGINGGNNMRSTAGAVGSYLFTVQELKAVAIDNSMQILNSGGNPVTDWLVYNSADPNNTTAFMNTGMQAIYKVTLANQTGDDVSNMAVFVPIPTKGKDFGSAFQNDPFGFDLNFSDKDIPSGFQTTYIKMIANKQYAIGEVPQATDYNVVTDPTQADMIMITGDMAADAAPVDVTFNVTLPATLSAADYGHVNQWNAVPRYQAGGSSFVPLGYPERVEIAGGVITGTVYQDDDANGVMNGAETGIKAVAVSAIDNSKNDAGQPAPRILTTTTDADGNYEFTLVRNTTTDGTKNDDITITLIVTNPDGTFYIFSPTTTTGTKPSVVSAESTQASANKNGLTLKGDALTQTVDAGLIPAQVINYQTSTGGSIGSTSNEADNETVLYGSSPAEVPTNNPDTGYSFIGWRLDKDVTATTDITLKDGTIIEANATIPAGTILTTAEMATIAIKQTIIATATFALDTFTVTAAVEGGNGNITPDSQTVDYGADGTSITMTPNDGYEISSVTLTIAGEESDIKDNVNIDASTGVGTYPIENVMADITITVVYQEKANVTITYQSEDTNKGTVSRASESVAPATGTVQGSTASAKPGYSFVNWTDATNSAVATTSAYTPAQVNGLNVEGSFTAHFKANVYDIIYKLDGGTNDSSNPDSYTYGVGVDAFGDPEKEGYTFLGWQDIDGKPVTNIGSDELGDKTLSAVWEANVYDITYELDGGTNDGTNPDSYTYGVGVDSFKDPVKEGYTFLGWIDEDGNPITNIGPKELGAKTLIATWKVNNYKIVYTLNGGTNDKANPSKYTYGIGVDAFKDPVRQGYTFLGWVDADGQPITSIMATAVGDKILIAQWEAIPIKTKEAKIADMGTNTLLVVGFIGSLGLGLAVLNRQSKQ